MSESHEIGKQLEVLVATLTSSKLQKNSGAGYYEKMDVRGRSILWSCKASNVETGTMSIPKYQIAEVREAAQGPSGTGDLPAIAVRNGDEIGVYMSLSDFSELLASDIEIPRDKTEERRRRAATPSALR